MTFLGMTRAGAVAALMALSVAVPLGAKAEELKMTSFVPPMQLGWKHLEEWSKMIAEKSDGRLTFAHFPAGQMGPPPRRFDLVRTGAADIGFFLHGFTPGRFPLTEMALLPGTFESAEQGAYVMNTLAPEWLTKEHEGTKILAIVTLPSLSIFTPGTPIKSLADMEGKRIRHPGAVVGDTLTNLGAVPVGVPAPEMNDALLKGVIDGLATAYEAVAVFNMTETVDYALRTRIGSGVFGVVMNQETYDALDDDLKALIDESTGVPMARALSKAFSEAESTWAGKLAGQIEELTLAPADAEVFDAALAASVEKQIEALVASGAPAREMREAIAETAKSYMP